MQLARAPRGDTGSGSAPNLALPNAPLQLRVLLLVLTWEPRLGTSLEGWGCDALAHRCACIDESMGVVLVAVSTEISGHTQPFCTALASVRVVAGSSNLSMCFGSSLVLPVFWLPHSVNPLNIIP